MIVDILEPKYTLDQKIEILKIALQTQNGIDCILEQCGNDFRQYIDKYRHGDETELAILTILMGLSAFDKKRGNHADPSGLEESDED